MILNQKSQTKKKFNLKLIPILLVIFLFVFYLASPRGRIDQSIYTINSQDIPQAFEGFRIVQVSDLHNKQWDRKLIDMIEGQKPDVIFITGDLLDSRKPDLKLALDFVSSIKELAPIYYVSGNHEFFLDYPSIKSELESLGVIVLDNANLSFEKSGQAIQIMGIMDPRFLDYFPGETSSMQISNVLSDEKFESENYRILLSHRPEAFDVYVNKGIDLVFTGHAHGGQFRLPLIGGLVAPGQGFFPKYTHGIYEDNKTKMVVSRGLGDSILPVRFNNNYELVTVVLQRK